MAQYCLKCNSLCEPGARYCMTCGAALSRICPNCGSVLDMQAIFCMNCGFKVTTVPPQDDVPEFSAEQPIQRHGNPTQQPAPSRRPESPDRIEYEDAKEFFRTHMNKPGTTQAEMQTGPTVTEPAKNHVQPQAKPVEKANSQETPLPEVEVEVEEDVEANATVEVEEDVEANATVKVEEDVEANATVKVEEDAEVNAEAEAQGKRDYDEGDVLEEDEGYVTDGEKSDDGSKGKMDPLSFLRKHRPGNTSEQHDESSLASRIKNFKMAANADGYYNDRKPVDFDEENKEHTGLDKKLVMQNGLMILAVVAGAIIIIFFQMHV